MSQIKLVIPWNDFLNTLETNPLANLWCVKRPWTYDGPAFHAKTRQLRLMCIER